MLVSASFPNWTPVAVADTANYTDGGHHTIQGGVSTQRNVLIEMYLAGLAAASSPALLFLGRTTTVGATLTAGRLQPVDPSSVLIANPPVSFATSTTKPQRSSTAGMLVGAAFNAFGGVIRWYKGPEQFIASLGAAQPLGELSLSAFTGGTPGAINSTIIIDAI